MLCEMRKLRCSTSSSFHAFLYLDSSSVQLEVGCEARIVKVTGLVDEVSKAEAIINTKYMNTICYGTHEICTPGKCFQKGGHVLSVFYRI